jgi:hypothetical protein
MQICLRQYPKKNFRWHILVCEAWHGVRPTPEHQVRHRDGTKTNNRPDNLCWGTAKENHSDRWDHGTYPIGETHPRSILTANHAREIKWRVGMGQSNPEIARMMGAPINRSRVNDIRRGKAWKTLTIAGEEFLDDYASSTRSAT